MELPKRDSSRKENSEARNDIDENGVSYLKTGTNMQWYFCR